MEYKHPDIKAFYSTNVREHAEDWAVAQLINLGAIDWCEDIEDSVVTPKGEAMLAEFLAQFIN